MPLTTKGEEILNNMKKEYGAEGERVFYASKNKGVISGVDSEGNRHDAVRRQDLPDINQYTTLSQVRAGKALAARYLNEEKDPRVQEYFRDALEAYTDIESLFVKAGRKDADNDRPVSERIDSMVEQVNSLGKGAKSIAGRLDANNPYSVVFRVTAEGKTAEIPIDIFAPTVEQAQELAMKKVKSDFKPDQISLLRIEHGHR